MNEIYWITVLGNVSTFCIVLAIVILMCCGITFIACSADFYSVDEYIKGIKTLKIIPICCISIFMFLVSCFLPTTNQLYMIYGIGTIIDYVQDSEKVKQIPDKAINAIDVWLEQLNKEK